MAHDFTPANIPAGTTGMVMVAAVDTAAPVDATSAWPSGWSQLGAITDDGVKGKYDTSYEDVNIWQQLAPVRKLAKEVKFSLEFTANEWNRVTLPLYFSGGTITDLTTVGHSRISIPAIPTPDERAFGVEFVDGLNYWRLVMPKGMVTGRGDLTINSKKAVEMQMTIEGLVQANTDLGFWLTNATGVLA
ncbi:hypothetical protein [Frankia sp. Cr1]|uniref:phage tail tube protein n=1 Tax=Frankia sp. Cr1 TaxID=3073931 RepID=UPI002AD372E2|nr:hypothetical protein [Frankia sp. Cr1]